MGKVPGTSLVATARTRGGSPPLIQTRIRTEHDRRARVSRSPSPSPDGRRGYELFLAHRVLPSERSDLGALTRRFRGVKSSIKARMIPCICTVGRSRGLEGGVSSCHRCEISLTSRPSAIWAPLPLQRCTRCSRQAYVEPALRARNDPASNRAHRSAPLAQCTCHRKVPLRPTHYGTLRYDFDAVHRWKISGGAWR